MTTFDPKAVSFHQFAQAMRKVGYATTDPQALLAAYFTVQQMLNGKADRGPVPSIVLDGPPGTGKSYMAECVAWMFQALGLDAWNVHRGGEQGVVGFLTVCMSRLGVDLRDQCKDVPPPRLLLRTNLPQILTEQIK